MATQGMVSILNKEKVIFKIISGCNGYLAKIVSSELQEFIKYELKLDLRKLTLSRIYSLVKEIGFGCGKCLVVMNRRGDFIYDQRQYTRKDVENILNRLYLDKFEPYFNPRWESGMADHIETVKIDKS